MSDLKLALSLSPSSVLSGERFVARVEFLNSSAQTLAIENPAGMSPGPLEYELRRIDAAQRPPHTLSRLEFVDSLLGGDMLPPEPPELVDLEPQQVYVVQEPVGEYAAGRVAPGRYLMTAHWRQNDLEAASDPVELTIGAPVTQCLATAFCPESGEVVGLLDHREPAGSIVAERRIRKLLPSVATLVRRHFVAAPHAVTDVGIAVHTRDGLKGRWHAWLQAQELWAARTWGNAITAKPAPTSVAIGDLRFSPPLIHLPTNQGAILLLGTSGTGEATLQRCTAEEQRITSAAPLPLGTARASRAMTRAVSDRGRAAVFWTVEQGRGSSLHGCVINERGRLQEAPRVLYESDHPILAWDVSPVGKLPLSEVHVLSGPDAEGRLTCARVPWRDQPVRDVLPAPRNPVRSWAISASTQQGPWIVAHVDRAILVTTPSLKAWGARWEVGEGEILTAEHLHVLGSGREAWAGWYEPDYGLRYVRI